MCLCGQHQQEDLADWECQTQTLERSSASAQTAEHTQTRAYALCARTHANTCVGSYLPTCLPRRCPSSRSLPPRCPPQRRGLVVLAEVQPQLLPQVLLRHLERLPHVGEAHRQQVLRP